MQSNKISLWMEQLGENIPPRASLNSITQADVAIIGAGFTGLWTAYYLKTQSPELNIAIVEANIAGYGASGRNGGWLIGEIAGQDKLLANVSASLREQAHTLLHCIPDEVARVLEQETIDCDFKKGGKLTIAARYPEQASRLKAEYEELLTMGYSEQDEQWLEGDALAERIKIHNAGGAIYSPHCASIHPAKLVRGLADAVERLGVKIYEQSKVTDWTAGKVNTEHGSVNATWVVPSLEAYGLSIRKSPTEYSKYNLPVQSLIIATEPLSNEMWESIGLQNGEVFCENSLQVTYANRTKDNRLVFGTRGSYLFGGKIKTEFNLTDHDIAVRKKIVVELFPQLENVKITHSWGGNLAIAREFHPNMLLDQKNKIAMSGGYGGAGVGASNLGGRTIADLILNKDTLLTQMPWVYKTKSTEKQNRKIRSWEAEPIPWLGYRAISKTFEVEDRVLSNPRSKKWQRKLASTLGDFFSQFVS